VLVNTRTGEIFGSGGTSAQSSEDRINAPFPKDPAARGLFPKEQSALEALFGRESSGNHNSSGNGSNYAPSREMFSVQSTNTSQQKSSQTAFNLEETHVASQFVPQKFYWQLHKKYILSPSQSGLTIIDQHAAHERILYERALKAMNEGFSYGQELLFPVFMRCTGAEAALVEELHEDLTQMGFVIAVLSPQELEIRAVPADVRTGREEDALRELLEQYREYTELRHTTARDNLAASFGCRSAIRAGDMLTLQEMRALADDLYATQMPYACPHGRPIIIEISLEEFDRRFGRTS
jgi:DNA mismatch repair protein MutL